MSSSGVGECPPMRSEEDLAPPPPQVLPVKTQGGEHHDGEQLSSGVESKTEPSVTRRQKDHGPGSTQKRAEARLIDRTTRTLSSAEERAQSKSSSHKKTQPPKQRSSKSSGKAPGSPQRRSRRIQAQKLTTTKVPRVKTEQAKEPGLNPLDALHANGEEGTKMTTPSKKSGVGSTAGETLGTGSVTETHTPSKAEAKLLKSARYFESEKHTKSPADSKVFINVDAGVTPRSTQRRRRENRIRDSFSPMEKLEILDEEKNNNRLASPPEKPNPPSLPASPHLFGKALCKASPTLKNENITAKTSPLLASPLHSSRAVGAPFTDEKEAVEGAGKDLSKKLAAIEPSASGQSNMRMAAASPVDTRGTPPPAGARRLAGRAAKPRRAGQAAPPAPRGRPPPVRGRSPSPAPASCAPPGPPPPRPAPVPALPTGAALGALEERHSAPAAPGRSLSPTAAAAAAALDRPARAPSPLPRLLRQLSSSAAASAEELLGRCPPPAQLLAAAGELGRETAPYFREGARRAAELLHAAPAEALAAAFGLGLAFFGGTFALSIAAAEAWYASGWQTTKGAVQVLWREWCTFCERTQAEQQRRASLGPPRDWREKEHNSPGAGDVESPVGQGEGLRRRVRGRPSSSHEDNQTGSYFWGDGPGLESVGLGGADGDPWAGEGKKGKGERHGGGGGGGEGGGFSLGAEAGRAGALLGRKVLLFLEHCERPWEVQVAAGGLWASAAAVVACVKVRYAACAALGVGLGNLFRPAARRLLEPALGRVLGRRYRRWAPVLVGAACQAAGLALAWLAQRAVSALQGGLRGGQLFARHTLSLAKRAGHFRGQESALEELLLGLAVAGAGVWFQLTHLFGLPFPWNVLLLPLRVVEAALVWVKAW